MDGGAYANLPDAAEGEGDASVVDAAPGCASLSACCSPLTGASQGLCTTVAASGDATNCSTELTQLQSEGDCTGVTILASQIQVPANRIVSDGTTLFWTTSESSPGLFAMPVHGGTITTLLSAQTANAQGGAFLAVDDVNVYVLEGYSLIRLPKNGAAATLINESGGTVTSATALAGTAYWVEPIGNPGPSQPTAVKSAPLLGDTVTTIATFIPKTPAVNNLGVTSSTVFVQLLDSALFDFPMSGAPASGPTPVDAAPCGALSSDTDAVYCPATTGSNQRIASDSTTTSLGQAVNSSFIVFDDTYIYWVDNTTVGTILKAPKAGGGTATAIANDTSPTAIAVDATSIYWSDQEGYIKSVPK